MWHHVHWLQLERTRVSASSHSSVMPMFLNLNLIHQGLLSKLWMPFASFFKITFTFPMSTSSTTKNTVTTFGARQFVNSWSDLAQSRRDIWDVEYCSEIRSPPAEGMILPSWSLFIRGMCFLYEFHSFNQHNLMRQQQSTSECVVCHSPHVPAILNEHMAPRLKLTSGRAMMDKRNSPPPNSADSAWFRDGLVPYLFFNHHWIHWIIALDTSMWSSFFKNIPGCKIIDS